MELLIFISQIFDVSHIEYSTKRIILYRELVSDMVIDRQTLRNNLFQINTGILIYPFRNFSDR